MLLPTQVRLKLEVWRYFICGLPLLEHEVVPREHTLPWTWNETKYTSYKLFWHKDYHIFHAGIPKLLHSAWLCHVTIKTQKELSWVIITIKTQKELMSY